MNCLVYTGEKLGINQQTVLINQLKLYPGVSPSIGEY